MCKGITSLIAAHICLLACWPLNAQEPRGQGLKYVPKHGEPVIEEMQEENKQARQARDAETRRIREAQEEMRAKRAGEQREIRFDFTGVRKPESLDVFQTAFHFPPVSQFNTGNCWCFSTTSFFESELRRLTGQEIKLSEMYTVYHEYLEKARRYVRERGASFFDKGSEGNAVMLVWRNYGIVPAEAYRGARRPDGRYDDEDMVAEMKAYLEHVKKYGLWDEELVLASLRLIMDKYMGRPPEHIVHGGAEMTPQQFLADVLRLNLDDYVCVMSTLAQPFHEFGEYEVEANWWHSRDYYNVPLEEFYGIITYAVRRGYTVRLNGDVTEPGHDRSEDAAIIPSFDIPRAYIDQDARELRFFSKATDDDHDVHLVGYTSVGDYDWFLVKDSYDAASVGRFKGYMFYREDYIKLKTLTYIVHKDAVRAVVERFEEQQLGRTVREVPAVASEGAGG
jgi:bleomycin hydrolase